MIIKVVRRLILAGMLTLLCLGMAYSQLNHVPMEVENGQIFQNFFVDLNGDGTRENVQVKVYGLAESEWFAQILVRDDKGKLIWQGPHNKNRQDPLVFGNFNYGSAMPQALGDFNGDGKIELIATSPVSDLRPQSFRLFVWQGGKFVFVAEKTLLENPAGSGIYRWSKVWGADCGTPHGLWIMAVKADKDPGRYLVEVLSADSRLGVAKAVPTAQGFKIINWQKKLKTLGN